MFEGKQKEEMTAKMKQNTLSDSTATNVSIHLQQDEDNLQPQSEKWHPIQSKP